LAKWSQTWQEASSFGSIRPTNMAAVTKNRTYGKNVEVIQAEIVGHSDLHLCAMFLTVHDKLTCEISSTWTK
jgi:hypothetical protein